MGERASQVAQQWVLSIKIRAYALSEKVNSRIRAKLKIRKENFITITRNKVWRGQLFPWRQWNRIKIDLLVVRNNFYVRCTQWWEAIISQIDQKELVKKMTSWNYINFGRQSIETEANFSVKSISKGNLKGKKVSRFSATTELKPVMQVLKYRNWRVSRAETNQSHISCAAQSKDHSINQVLNSYSESKRNPGCKHLP